MTISLSNHHSSARPVDGFVEDPFDEDNPDEARLRGLTHQQLADRLTWLAWYQPGVFTTGRAPRSARRRSSTPVTPQNWLGAGQGSAPART
jgi:hypothetical protein